MATDYPISLLCDLLDVSRSSYYYEHLEHDDDEVRQAIKEIAADFLPMDPGVSAHNLDESRIN